MFLADKGRPTMTLAFGDRVLSRRQSLVYPGLEAWARPSPASGRAIAPPAWRDPSVAASRPRKAAISWLVRSRQWPGARSPSAIGPDSTRTRRSVGKPAAAVIRRTCRFAPFANRQAKPCGRHVLAKPDRHRTVGQEGLGVQKLNVGGSGRTVTKCHAGRRASSAWAVGTCSTCTR